MSSSSKTVQTKNRPLKVKRKQRKKKAKNVDIDRAKLAEQLRARFGGRKREDDITIAHVDKTTHEIKHPSSYERQMARAIDAHMNRLMQPEAPENLVKSHRLCALCQHPSCFDALGELYGPYYAELSQFSAPSAPPKFLLSDDVNKSKADGSDAEESLPFIDLWVHGDCALWAADLHLIGGRFVGFEKFMSLYWSQKCRVCSKIGASIVVQNEHNHFVHYPCAVQENYHLNESSFTCQPPPRAPGSEDCADMHIFASNFCILVNNQSF